VTLPPCLIFEGQNLNSGWIPNETPAGWKFITSKKGWTSDLIGFEWLKSHFQPFVSRTSNSRYLLIIDGHSSHVTARFIAYCITSKIDLFLLPPYSLYKIQPLDLSIFGPLKTAINLEVDRIFRYSTTRLCNGGGMPKVFIGLNQGLTKAGEEVVGTMNTVRCNHCSRYMS
jgi:hypothetical protein